MSVLTVDGKEYMIGVQIAQLLKRETFNLYRSLKIKGIDVLRAENEQVDYLVNCNSIKRGTHSVTLVPLDDGLSFVLGALGTGSGSDERRSRTEGRGPRGGKKLKRSMDEMSAAGDESSGGDSPTSNKEKNARNEQWEPKSSRNASRVLLRKSLSLSGSDSEMSQLLKSELELQVQLPASSISSPSSWPAPQQPRPPQMQLSGTCAGAAAEEARGPWHMLLLIASAEHAQL